MSIRFLILLIAAIPAVTLAGQAPLPPDINPVTLSRLPPVTPADLDAEGQKLLAAQDERDAGPGPRAPRDLQPEASEGTGLLGRALGVPTGETSRLGPRMYQARGADYREGDRPAVRMVRARARGPAAGLEQSVIDVVKYDRDVKGLAEKDATVIQFLRALFREHKVSSELWARQIRAVRTAEHDRDHAAHGRLLHGRHDDERRRSAPAADAPAAAAAARREDDDDAGTEGDSRWRAWPARVSTRRARLNRPGGRPTAAMPQGGDIRRSRRSTRRTSRR